MYTGHKGKLGAPEGRSHMLGHVCIHMLVRVSILTFCWYDHHAGMAAESEQIQRQQ